MAKKQKLLKRLWRFIWGGYRLGGLNGLYHYVRCHLWNRYHVINVSGEDNYDWGWIDRDHLLLLANFKILRDFVEEEDPRVGLRAYEDYGCKKHDDFDFVKPQLLDEQEIRTLYVWWTDDRPKSHELLKSLGRDYKKYGELEEKLEQKDEEMLIRLIKVRGRLWT